MDNRIKNIYKNLEKDVDIIVIHTAGEPFIDQTFYYVTSLTEGIFEGSLAFLKNDYSLEVFASLLEEESAKKGDFELNVFKTKKQREEMVFKKLKNIKKIGINSEELTYKNYLTLKNLAPKAEFIDVGDAVKKSRLVKDKKEIQTLKKACKIASEVADEIPKFFKEGMKEYELASEVNYLLQKKGAAGPAFVTISSFGPMSAEPHYIGGSEKLKKGDFVLLDFGALYKRYRSDITRTWVFGKASAVQKEIYENVRIAQQKGLDAIKAGVNGKDVHKAVEDFINGTKYKGRFTHSTGHSIGLSTHDGSALSSQIDIDLEENMVFTVEPGIYIPGFGGVRIEDDVVVKKDGVEILTDAKKDLMEV